MDGFIVVSYGLFLGQWTERESISVGSYVKCLPLGSSDDIVAPPLAMIFNGQVEA